MKHAELVDRAVRWLRRQGCRVVLHDPFRTPLAEQPDAIGWRDGLSLLVEAKVSRSDYLADGKKLWRRKPGQGMGDWRFYITPPGLIEPSELPTGWGLLEPHGRGVRRIVGGPRGNIWWDSVPFLDSNKREESRMLVSALAQPSARPRRAEVPRRGIAVEAWAAVAEEERREPEWP